MYSGKNLSFIYNLILMDENKDILVLLTAIWEGKATPAQKLQFDNWLNESEANRNYYRALSRITLKEEKMPEESRKRILDKVITGIARKENKREVLILRWSLAASIALIVSLSAFFLVSQKFRTPAPSMVEAQTAYGVKSRVTLPDGSVVFLNSGSRLNYPSQFTGEERQVSLSGEAYFEVTHNADKPFVVHTGKARTKVYGTHFNISAYSQDNKVETTLLEGRVGISLGPDESGMEEIILAPDQQAICNLKTNKISIRKVDASLTTVWKEGRCYFENESFASIAKKLERTFNVGIVISSPELARQSFNGLFSKNRNIFQLLDVMKINSHFSYKVVNDTIFINKD